MLISFVSFLFFFFVSFHCKENQTQEGQRRSVRVQRVSDREFPGNDFPRTESSIEEIVNLRAALLGSGDYFEKLRRDFPNLDNLIQQEASISHKPHNRILTYKMLLILSEEITEPRSTSENNKNIY